MTEDHPAHTAAGRTPNYPEPVTPADQHPTGCVLCKVTDEPHVWTPPTAPPPKEHKVPLIPGLYKGSRPW